MPRMLEEEEAELDHDSAFWVGAWTAVVLILFTMCFDIVGEKISDCLQDAAGEKEKEKDEVSFDKTYANFVLKLWRRFRAEVTALGFLAFTVFIFAESKFFKAVTDASKDIHAPAEEEGGEKKEDEGEKKEGEGEAATEAPAAKGAGEGEGEAAKATGEGEGAAERRLLDLNQMAFAALAVPARQLVATASRMLAQPTSAARQLEGEEGGGEEGRGAGEAVATLLHHLPRCKRYMSPSKEWLKEHVESVHYSFFIAMCLYFILLWITCTVHNRRFRGNVGKTQGFEKRIAYLLGKASEWPETKALMQSDPDVASAVKSGTICYATFIKASSHEFINTLIEFPATTWLIALVYALIQATFSFSACMDEHLVHHIFQYAFYAIYGYVGLRTMIFFCCIRGGSSTPWPLECLDRFLLWPIGPFATGHSPCISQPKRKWAICVQQAWLWFQLQRIAFVIVNTSGTLYKEAGYERDSLIADMVVTSSILLVASFVAFPLTIEMYSLPPMIDPKEGDECVKNALIYSKTAMGQIKAKEQIEVQVKSE